MKALALLLLLALGGCAHRGICDSDTGIGMVFDYVVCGNRG